MRISFHALDDQAGPVSAAQALDDLPWAWMVSLTTATLLAPLARTAVTLSHVLADHAVREDESVLARMCVGVEEWVMLCPTDQRGHEPIKRVNCFACRSKQQSPHRPCADVRISSSSSSVRHCDHSCAW